LPEHLNPKFPREITRSNLMDCYEQEVAAQHNSEKNNDKNPKINIRYFLLLLIRSRVNLSLEKKQSGKHPLLFNTD